VTDLPAVQASTPALVRHRGAVAALSIPEAMQFAEAVAKADGMIPRAYLGNPGKILACVLAGQELGVGPMATLRAFHIVEGKPCAAADFWVARLRAAGALIFGKTNLDQFATGLVGLRTPYPPPRNRWDPARVPGGSSSGSAVAVAHGIVPLALGTDTAGSGRVPAALNGIVGLKPSIGAIPTAGVVPACRSLDCVSIFASTLADAWAAYRALAGEDPEDPFSRPIVWREPGAVPRRIAVPRGADLHLDDAPARLAWAAACAHLPGAVEADIAALLAAAQLLYDGPWIAERAVAFGGFAAAHPGALHPVTQRILDGAARFSAADAFAGLHALAGYRRAAERFFARHDVLAVPSVPCFPTLAELAADPIGPNARLGTYTNFVNLLDLAAIAVPGPPRSDGLPAGVTFIGPRGSEATLAALAAAFATALSAARDAA